MDSLHTQTATTENSAEIKQNNKIRARLPLNFKIKTVVPSSNSFLYTPPQPTVEEVVQIKELHLPYLTLPFQFSHSRGNIFIFKTSPFLEGILQP